MVVLAVMTVSRSMNINFLSAEEKDLEGNAQLLENICPTLQHLNPSQMKEICELLNSYQIIFGDSAPYFNTNPIRQHPYKIGATKKEMLKNE